MCAFRLFVFQFVSFKRAAKVTLFSNLPNFIAKVFVLVFQPYKWYRANKLTVNPELFNR